MKGECEGRKGWERKDVHLTLHGHPSDSCFYLDVHDPLRPLNMSVELAGLRRIDIGILRSSHISRDAVHRRQNTRRKTVIPTLISITVAIKDVPIQEKQF